MEIKITLKMRILLAIDERLNYAGKIAKSLKTYISSVGTILPKMEKEGLIESKKIGRKKLVTLTTKGERAKLLLNQLLSL